MPTDYPSNKENPRDSVTDSANAAWGVGVLIAILFVVVGAVYWSMSGSRTANTNPRTAPSTGSWRIGSVVLPSPKKKQAGIVQDERGQEQPASKPDARRGTANKREILANMGGDGLTNPDDVPDKKNITATSPHKPAIEK